VPPAAFAPSLTEITMDPRIAATVGYLGTVAAAVLCAVLMSGHPLHPGPLAAQPGCRDQLDRDGAVDPCATATYPPGIRLEIHGIPRPQGPRLAA
jgi:hypothetical protein